MRTIVLATDEGLRVVQSQGPGEHKPIAWIAAEGLTDAMAIDVGTALADLTEHAQKASGRRRPVHVQPDAVLAPGTHTAPPDEAVALPAARFHALTPPADGAQFVTLAGVKVGLLGLQLLNVVRAHPNGIKPRELWDAVGSQRVNGSQPGATSLKHLHRNGLIRKVGDRGWSVSYFPKRIRGID